MAMKIRNVSGTSARRNCRCGTWLQHYYNHGGTGSSCVVCRRAANVGAHVMALESLLGVLEWHVRGELIVPLCLVCNMKSGWMQAVLDFDQVSANTQSMGCATR